MRWIRTRLALWVGSLLLGVGVWPAQAMPPSENLFPPTTAGFVAVANVKDLTEHWNKTQLGQLMADPAMKPFTEDIRRQFQNRWSGIHQRLGLTLDDLKDVPGGEVGMALIRPAPGKAALAIVIDVTDHVPQATKLLEKVSANLKKQGAKPITDRELKGPDPIKAFKLPKPLRDEKPRLLKGEKAEPDKAGKTQPRRAYHFLSNNVLATSDDLEVIKGLLARVQGARLKGLAHVPGFQAVMKRCAADAGNVMPQIRWFAFPLDYIEAVRAATPEEKRRKGKPVLDVLRRQGFGAIKGVGGFASFATEGLELVHRTSVYAPPPREKAMKMFKFPGRRETAPGRWVPNDFAPQAWVPRDIATYSSFYCDALCAFDNFGPLFDELLGEPEFLFRAALAYEGPLAKGKLPKEFRAEFKKLKIEFSPRVKIATREPGKYWEISDKDLKSGEEKLCEVRRMGGELRVYRLPTGIWEDVKESLKKDPNGPQIDLRADLIVHLGKRIGKQEPKSARITVITDYELPITTTSERLLFAIETSDPKRVAETLEKALKGDPRVKRRVLQGHVIWEIVEEKAAHDPPKIDLGEVPSLTPGEEEDDPEEEAERLLPHRAVTVANGHLLIASHLDFLKKILKFYKERKLKLANQRTALGACMDYILVTRTLDGFGFSDQCARVFSRTDEEWRPTYELIRQGKMPESETMFGRLLNVLLGEGKKGVVRQQKIEGGKLPDYQIVRRYLGPAGLLVTSEQSGWFLKGFILKK